MAFRPGVINPVLAAQMAAAHQRISGGRLMLNIVTGGEPREQARFGDTDPKEVRYARTEEFLTVLRGTWEQPPFDFHGRFFDVAGAVVRDGIDPQPDIYFGGSSDAALGVAARRADVYLTWGEPLDLVAEKLDAVRSLAADHGRTLRFGLRIHTLSRDTADEAWAQAQWLLDGLDPDLIEATLAMQGDSQSTGQARMTQLRGGRTRFTDAHELEIAPNLWSGVGLVRGGAGTALVGSHDEVADRIAEYADLGISELILSGYPHVEEARWLAEPGSRLRACGRGSRRVACWTPTRRGSPYPPDAHPGLYPGPMDDVAWGALTLSLTLLGALCTWFAYRRRGAAAAVRGAGLTLLPIALLLTHTLRMVTRIVDAIGDWATSLVFSPAVWVGVILGGLGITLFVVGGMMRDRQLGTTPRGRRTSSDAGAPGALPAGRKARSAPVVSSGDPETDEIEALLRKHGIS